MPQSPSNFPAWGKHACLASGAVLGAAASSMLNFGDDGVTLGTVLGNLLGAGTTIASGVMSGTLGNVLHEHLNTRLTDSHGLLSNHHLHHLTAEAVQLVLIDGSKNEDKLSLYDKEEVRRLAAAIPKAWEELSQIDGFDQQLASLSSGQLKHWFHAASAEKPEALDAAAWKIILTAISRKEECKLDDRALDRLAQRLTWQLPEAARELLKQGGRAFNGLILNLLGEIHGTICEVLPLQLELLAGSIENREQLGELVDALRQVTDKLSSQAKGQAGQQALLAELQTQQGKWEGLQESIDLIRRENSRSHDEIKEMLALILSRISTPRQPAAEEADGTFRQAVDIGAVEGLVARSGERKKLKGWLLSKNQANAKQVVYVHGMPGVGKSYLVEWFVGKEWHGKYGPSANRIRCVLRSGSEAAPTSEQELLSDICDQLKLSPSNPEIWAQLNAVLATPGYLLLIENVDDELTMRSVASVVHRLKSGSILITGRVATSGSASGWNALPLTSFDVGDGLKQLKKELGKTYKQYSEDDLRTLVESLGGLALALHLAAGHLQEGSSPEQFLMMLRGSEFELRPADLADPLLTQNAAKAILDASFEISCNAFRQLAEDKASRWLPALQSLGYAPESGVGISLGAAIADLEESEFLSFCTRAICLSLMDRVSKAERPDFAIRIHSLLAEWLRRRSDDKPLERLEDWFRSRLEKTSPVTDQLKYEHEALTRMLNRKRRFNSYAATTLDPQPLYTTNRQLHSKMVSIEADLRNKIYNN
ncbi:hypothetical protein GC197_04465 [bacterium]|nr:hypothetical protein [bacterium]